MTQNSHRDSPITAQDKKELPDNWLYDRSVLGWTLNHNLSKQLPFLFQIFSLYCNLYFKLTSQNHLKGGRKLFRLLSGIFYQLSPDRYVEMQLSGYQVFLDPIDMRFFQVVNELASQDTDTRVLSHLLSQGDTFLDVGANHGSFAIVASKLVGANGFVLAVEPQPRLARALGKSLEANAFSKFQIHQLAVGDANGEIELLVPRGTSGSAGVYPEHSATHQYNAIKVPLKRFDDLVNWQHFTGKVVLKLDVEGSECAFLSGASKMITALKPTLIIEIHPTSLKAAGSSGLILKQLLRSLGYTSYSEISDRAFNLEDVNDLENLNTDVQRNVLVMSL